MTDEALSQRDTVALTVLAIVSSTPRTLYALLECTGLAKGSLGSAIDRLLQARYVQAIPEEEARQKGYVKSWHRQKVWKATDGGEKALHHLVREFVDDSERPGFQMPADFEQGLRWVWILRALYPDHVERFLKRFINARSRLGDEVDDETMREGLSKGTLVSMEFWQLRNFCLAKRYRAETEALLQLQTQLTSPVLE